MIIGLHGTAGVGKSEAGRILEQHGFRSVHPIAAGKAMVRAWLAHWGYDDVMIERLVEGDLKEAPGAIPEFHGISSRQFQQDLGRLLNSYGPEFTVGNEIDLATRGGSSVVLPSIRYQNEADVLRSHGGEILKVSRPGFEPVNDHVSERPFPPSLIDGEISNDGDLADLESALLDHLAGADQAKAA